jgi:hypothetical protein
MTDYVLRALLIAKKKTELALHQYQLVPVNLG